MTHNMPTAERAQGDHCSYATRAYPNPRTSGSTVAESCAPVCTNLASLPTCCYTAAMDSANTVHMLQAKSSNIQPVIVCDCYKYSQQISQATAVAVAQAIAGSYGGSTCTNLSGSGATAVAAAGK